MSKSATAAQVRPQVQREARPAANEFAHVFTALQAELADLRKLLKLAAPVESEKSRK